jgi:uncharacterized damage-inducible protein DinB
MLRPDSNEYNPYYAGYVSLVTEDDVLVAMEEQIKEIERLVTSIPEEKGTHAYEPGKWTVKEVLGHLVDTERVFAYRALRISKGDTTELPGYDQDLFVERGGFNEAPIKSLLAELLHMRRANIIFFSGLSEERSALAGSANGNPVTVRALAYMMVGHVRHHLNILSERYL